MKYFYTDPIAAMWMSKHHGMRFQEMDEELVNVEPKCLYQFLHPAPEEKLWIHPDSEHLLEPIASEYSEHDGYIIGDLCMVESNERVCFGDLEQCKGFSGGMDEIKVIQRNGIAFMWPESENM